MPQPATEHVDTGGGTLRELTLRGMILGALITIIFTASNVYLGLKVGLTFSSSIPAAVMSMGLLRLARDSNILENNMVQTQASAAGTLSAIIFVVPGLVMIGHWHGFPFWQTAGICAVGGTLGVMYSIPLRRALVVESNLVYPEGVAAAEILRAGSRQPDLAKPTGATPDGAEPGLADIAIGGAVGAGFSFLVSGMRLFSDGLSWWFTADGAVFRLVTGYSLALVGAGYLIGIVAGLAMLLGVVLAWGVAVPILTASTSMPAGSSVADFATGIWSHQVRFIGAGTIGTGAIWTLVGLLRPMAEGVRTSLRAMRDIRAGRDPTVPRVERDIPFQWVAACTLILVVPMLVLFVSFISSAGVPVTGLLFWALVICGVLFAFVFGFLIAATCGYMAGLVGSSASPISGIGIVGVTAVSLLVLALMGGSGMLSTPEGSKLGIGIALFTTTVVVAIAAIANDNLQDLKTGQLIGATPWRQQVALVLGCFAGALVIPPILDLLYTAYGFVGALPHAGMDPMQALAAPQATLMTAIATGIFTHQLDWTMILIGVAIGVAAVMIDLLLERRGGTARLPVLAVGMGIYLPPSITVTIVIGSFIGWLIARRLQIKQGLILVSERIPVGTREALEKFMARPRRRGVLLASGMIVGESMVGVIMAGIIGISGNQAPLSVVGPGFENASVLLGLAAFAAVCIGFYARVMSTRS